MIAIKEKIKAITRHITETGAKDYIGEPLSQIEHALQAAYFAEKSGHSEEVILASLLHDIGHFYSTTEQFKMSDLGIVHHEWIGAKLAYDLHFSPKIALLIGYHVDAKRYLAGKKTRYYEQLSTASQQTLSYQGGPMGQDEMLAFEQLPYFKEILQVRINDEKAKEINLVVPDLNHYHSRMHHHIESHQQGRENLDDACLLPDFVDAQWVVDFKAQLHQQIEMHYAD